MLHRTGKLFALGHFFAVMLAALLVMPPVAQAKARRLPIPGNPARDQEEELEQLEGEPPAEAPHAHEHPAPHAYAPVTPEAEAPPEEEEPTGILRCLPHEIGGFTGEYIYTGEMFNNARGGLNTSQATAYRGNLDLVVTLDTAKQGMWEGGSFFLYGQTTHGRSLSTADVGDYQFVSNIDSAPRDYITQISEYWYRHDWNEGEFGFKVGKQDANADFAFADLGGDFINASFSLVPTVPLPTFPNPGLGAAGFVRLTERVSLGGGIYDGAPHGGQWGFATLGDNGAVSLLQLEIRQRMLEGLPAALRLGVWHHSGDWEEITSDPAPEVYTDNYGVWGTYDQLLLPEDNYAETEQGLGMFVQFGWAPNDRNLVDQHYGAALVYRGLVEGRDDDVLGLGVMSVLFGSPAWRATGATQESTTELFYKAYLTGNLSLQFDLQYVVNPSGLYRDALVPGMRFEAVF